MHKLQKHSCLTFSTDVMKTEQPMRVKIIRPVKRCSLMPRNLGCSPGAEHSDSSFRLLTWVMERTVAATNQGKPIREHTPSITPTMNRSRWYPQPFWRGKAPVNNGHVEQFWSTHSHRHVFKILLLQSATRVQSWDGKVPWVCVPSCWWWQLWSAGP